MGEAPQVHQARELLMETEICSQEEAKPWSLSFTLGLSFVIFIVFIGIQTIVAIGFLSLGRSFWPQIDSQEIFDRYYGTILILSTICSCPIGAALVLLFVWLRKKPSVGTYLALKRPRGKDLALWLVGAIVFVVASDTLTHLLGRPLVPEFIVKTYTTSHCVPGLYLALIVYAPLFEEFLFRGFFFKGVRDARVPWISRIFTRLYGPENADRAICLAWKAAAIIITSAAWSAIHMQYDLYGILHIFFFGILLGVAREKSGSIFVTMSMHSLVNLIATLEASIYINYLSVGR